MNTPALPDDRVLAAGGFDATLVENLGDHPLHAGAAPPEAVA